jgi:hypothetical protein
MKILKTLLCIAPLALFAVASCGTPHEEEAESFSAASLTSEERDLCAAQHIDTSVVMLLRDYTHATLSAFVPDSVWMYDDETFRAAQLQGVAFSATSTMAATYCDELGPALNAKGYTIYVFEQNFGLDNEKDKLAIVNTADQYEVLHETGTDGMNYDISNDSVIAIIRGLDEKYDLTLTGAGYDWCQFTIGKEPGSWQRMAEEIYKVCPDVVDQGTGTVEALADELRDYKTLYLWWD